MPYKYIVESVAGLRPSTRRAVAFLCCESNDEIDAEPVFNRLEPKREREVRNRFDHWIDGGTNKRWFHGFDNLEYRGCFAFKWKDKNQHHRFYGFLHHPLPARNAAFQVCVLASHATKNTWETDLAELDDVNRWRADPEVTAAVLRAFR